MSGVRFINIVLSTTAIFLWAGFVVNTWQKNREQRHAAVLAGQEKVEALAADEAGTLDRADEMAIAVSKEFQKITDEGLLKADKRAKERPAQKVEAAKPLNALDKRILSHNNLPQRKGDEQQVALKTEAPALKAPADKLADTVNDKTPLEATGKDLAGKQDRATDFNAKDHKLDDNPKVVAGSLSDKKTDSIEDDAAKISLKTKNDKETASRDLTKGPAWVVPTGADPDLSGMKTKVKDVADKPKEIGGHQLLADKDKIDAGKVVAAQTPEGAAGKRPVWVVPDAASPSYDESKAFKVGAIPWKVPTANDPIDVSKVGASITKMADNVKDGAQDAAETVGEKLSSIASDVKGSIVGDRPWVVPTGADPDYQHRDVIADGSPIWRVPDSVTPQYDEPLSDNQIQLAEALVKADKLKQVEQDETVNFYEILTASTDDKNVITTNKIENRLRDESVSSGKAPLNKISSQRVEIKKDTTRLSKDLVAVPVEKYSSPKKQLVKNESRLDTDSKDGNDVAGLASGKVDEAKLAENPAEKGDKLALAMNDKKPVAGGKVASKKANDTSVKDGEVKKDKSVSEKVRDGVNKVASKPKTALEKEIAKIKKADREFVERREKSRELTEAALRKANTKTDGASDEPQGADKSPDKKGVKDTAQDKQIADGTKADKPLWVVPDGADPDYGVVAQLERGLESVKDAAVETGTELADKVANIGTNVKEAIAKEKPWEVPTGVTWGDDDKKTPAKTEVQLAAKSDDPGPGKSKVKEADKLVAKDRIETKEKVVTNKAGKIVAQLDNAVEVAAVKEKKADNAAEKEAVQKQDTVAVPLPQKKVVAERKQLTDNHAKDIKVAARSPDIEAENDGPPSTAGKITPAGEAEVFVSARPKKNDDVIVIAAKDSEAVVDEKDKAAPKGDKKGLVTKIIGFFADKTKEKKGEEKTGREMSALEKARFGAIQALMVDSVDYEFTNKAKGEGRIKVAGRSQAGVRLSIYVGPRYLGEVEPNYKGEWVFDRDIYLPQGKHIVHAQQMSKGGLVLARKTIPYVQKIAAKAPEGYDPGVGIDLGDKALAVMNKKLKGDAGLDGSSKMGQETKVAALKTNVPLPLRKVLAEEVSLTQKSAKRVEVVDVPLPERKQVAALDMKSTVAALKMDKKGETVKADNDAVDKKEEEISDSDATDSKKAALKSGAIKDQPEAELKAGAVMKKAPSYYVVKAGDTLSKIAQKVYGDASRYQEILKLNPKVKSANLIYPKQKLIVASAGDVGKDVKVAAIDGKPSKVEKPADKAGEATKKKESTGKVDVDAGDQTAGQLKADFYTVKQGDSLWIIAKKVYGDGGRFKELIKLNPQLAKNPKLIKPNLKLRLKQG